MSAKRGYRGLIIGGVVSLVLVALVTILADRGQYARAIGSARWDLVPVALLFAGISYLSLSGNFAVIYRVFTDLIPGRDLLEIGYISVALSNMIFVGGVPEYLIRGLLLKPRRLTIAEILVPSALHSYTKDGIYLIGAPAATVYVLALRLLPPGQATGIAIATGLEMLFVLLISLAVFYAPFRLLVLRAANRLWALFSERDAWPALSSLHSTAEKGLGILRKSPRVDLRIALLILADWTAALVCFYLCFLAVGVNIGAGALVAGYVSGRTAGVISLSPGGAGVQEASIATFLSILGYPFAGALLAAVLFRVVYYFLPFVVSLVLYRGLVHKALGAMAAGE